MRPNFETMSKAELRAYVLAHKDDQEAFYVLADRFYAEPGTKINSIEDLEQLPELIKVRQKSRQDQTD